MAMAARIGLAIMAAQLGAAFTGRPLGYGQVLTRDPKQDTACPHPFSSIETLVLPSLLSFGRARLEDVHVGTAQARLPAARSF